jgi:hypothetical protein
MGSRPEWPNYFLFFVRLEVDGSGLDVCNVDFILILRLHVGGCRLPVHALRSFRIAWNKPTSWATSPSSVKRPSAPITYTSRPTSSAGGQQTDGEWWAGTAGKHETGPSEWGHVGPRSRGLDARRGERPASSVVVAASYMGEGRGRCLPPGRGFRAGHLRAPGLPSLRVATGGSTLYTVSTVIAEGQHTQQIQECPPAREPLFLVRGEYQA